MHRPHGDPVTGQQYPEFTKTLMARREESIPAWAERSRFDHYYRLAVNTVLPATEAGKAVCVGDEADHRAGSVSGESRGG